MKKYKKTIKLLLITFLFLAVPLNGWSMDDRIIAVVNDELITLNDLKDYLGSMYVQLSGSGKSQVEIERMMIDLEARGIEQLIENKIIINQAKELGLEVKPAAITERVDEIKVKYKNEQEFINALVIHGSTVSDLRNKIEEQLRIKYAIELEVKNKIFVNPQEVTNYYNAHLSEFEKPEKLDLNSIFITYTESKEVALDKAAQAVKFINEGQQFEEVAKQFSDAPSIGTIEKGHLIEQIENAIMALDPGEITPLIETDMGVYIIKLNKKMPGTTESLEDAKARIQQMIFQEKFRDRYRTWIDELRNDAYIEIKN